MEAVISPADSRFEDRPVSIIGLAIPGIKNTENNDVILASIYRVGLAPLTDAKRRLVRSLTSPEELDNWNNDSTRPFSLPHTATVGEARAIFAQSGNALIPVTRNGRYSGYCASTIQLDSLDNGMLRPQRVGGLATPLGVYMTTGHHTGGSGLAGMVAMGVVFGAAAVIINWLYPVFVSALVALFPQTRLVLFYSPDLLQIAFIIISTLALLQFTPLSALHAAEHMTIYALESDLPLDHETVRRQPRAHPRCGTNLAVILTGLQLSALFFYQMWDRVAWYGLVLYAALWIAALWFYWHRTGMWVQWNFTTRNPTDAELASGIKAGSEILTRFAADPHPLPTIGKRLWTMGFLQLLGGFIVTATVLETLLLLAFNHWDWNRLPPDWWVRLL